MYHTSQNTDRPRAITLSEIAGRISTAINAAPDLTGVWVVAETSDVRASGHCYLELVEKDANGRQTAKIRATIWQYVYYRLASKFRIETGLNFGSDLKVMVCVNAAFHPVFGLSLNIIDIDCSYTMGERLRRRREILDRLQAQGILDMNRSLPLPAVPQRIAVISAPGAAGYGDFMKHLHKNPAHIRFVTELFPAIMQGEQAPESIINALGAVEERAKDFDVVVIIRGGGATTDLLAFEDERLATNVANFTLPVITGIGHERDVTLLDFVACLPQKTPTAVADYLVSCGETMLSRLQSAGAAILQAVTERVGACRERLARYSAALPASSQAALVKADRRLANARIALASVADRRISPQLTRLDTLGRRFADAANYAIERRKQALAAKQQLLDVLSPEATLRRGYSITRVAGHAVTDMSQVNDGDVIETILAKGTITSIASKNNQ